MDIGSKEGPLCYRVLVFLEVGAGVGGTAGPVVEGGDGARGPCEVLQAPGGREPPRGAFYHRHLAVDVSYSSKRCRTILTQSNIFKIFF